MLQLAVTTLAFGGVAYAAPTEAGVTREELLGLKQQIRALKSELEQLKADQQQPAPAAKESAAVKSIQSSIDELTAQVDESRIGETKFLLTGSFFSNFVAPTHGDSTFVTAFEPIMLWKLNDKLFFEGEVELELEDGETGTKLEFAQLAYFVNDYLSVSAGKFLSPLNTYVERYAAQWINKFPDAPLALYDGIFPESEVGVQVRGNVPVGEMRSTYAFYLSNGPTLRTGEEDAGTLDFENYSDTNGNKAFGGRVSLLPIPSLELGYGFETARANSGDELIGDKSVLLNSVDADWSVDDESLAGRLGVRGQWGWNNVGRAEYLLDAPDGPVSFSNNRNGGYLQATYRPTRIAPVKNFELVTRYDRLDSPSNSPGGVDEDRISLGLDYWLASRVVLKSVYEIDNVKDGTDNDQFILGIAAGL